MATRYNKNINFNHATANTLKEMASSVDVKAKREERGCCSFVTVVCSGEKLILPSLACLARLALCASMLLMYLVSILRQLFKKTENGRCTATKALTVNCRKKVWYVEKMKAYDNLATLNCLKFQSIILEATGRMTQCRWLTFSLYLNKQTWWLCFLKLIGSAKSTAASNMLPFNRFSRSFASKKETDRLRTMMRIALSLPLPSITYVT